MNAESVVRCSPKPEKEKRGTFLMKPHVRTPNVMAVSERVTQRHRMAPSPWPS